MSFNCKYCETEFTNKYNLQKHLKTAKYCLKLRGEVVLNFKCNDCNKSFSRKHHLVDHMKICQKKDSNIIIKNLTEQLKEKNIIIQEQKETISKLQDKLENIAIKAVQRPTTTNMNKTQINNFIQKMEPISSEHMLEQAQNLTLEHIQKGASGYAEYALEYPLKERIACVDYSRRKMKFKDKDGNLITDPEMVKLAPMFFNSIKEKSSEIVYSQNDPNMDSVMFEAVAKLFNMNADVKNGADGIKSEFYHDFIKHVCSGSVVE